MNNNVVKNIEYPNFSNIRRNKIFETEFVDKTQNCLMIMYRQYEQGINLFVNKEVSDELENTDIGNITYEDIKIIAPSIEFYFQDPKIPTIIMSVINKEENFSFMEDGKIKHLDEDVVTLLYGIIKDGKKVTRFLNRRASLVSTWSDVPGSPEITFDEKVQSEDYLKLLVKILLYISIPAYKEIPISKKQLHRLGKAGIKNRPNRPIFKVIYVPSVINTNKKEHEENTGIRVTPHFRRGHFMMLRDERYKESRGKLIFRRPAMIHGGGLKDKLYVARTV